MRRTFECGLAALALTISSSACAGENSAGTASTSGATRSASLPPAESGVVQQGGTLVHADLDEPSGDGVLFGPHFTLELEQTGTVASFDFAAHVSDVEGDLRPADGEEFLVVDFGSPDSAPELVPFSNDSYVAEPTVALLVDGETTTLKSLPVDDTSVLVASVPTKSEVLLEVTDDGYAQTLDLRSGDRRDSRPGLYRASVDQSLGFQYSQQGQYVIQSEAGGSGSVSFRLNLESAYLLPYIDPLGWAPADQAWLVVYADDYGAMVYRESGLDPVFNLDANASFTLGTPDGDVMADPRADEFEPGLLGFGGGCLLFVVPEAFTTGTLSFNPKGTFFTGFAYGDWQTPPPTGTVELTFPA